MTPGQPASFGTHLKALREASGFTQEELATIAGLSVHAISALERGQRRRPHGDTVRALSTALDLTAAKREALQASARAPADEGAIDELTAFPLPLAPTVLVGRDNDVRTLRHWLSESDARLVTLTGPGGVGKTRLALEVARAIAEEGTTRAVFVPLAPVRTGELAGVTIAEALGLAQTTASRLPARARVALDKSPTLLVLDNFEQVLEAAPLVAELLAAVPALRVLVTSREALRVRGEREYAVEPLALEQDVDMTTTDLARSPAIRLFVERVRDVQPAFQLTVANRAVVTAICRKLDALPLALELVAPWLKVLTADGLLRRLELDVLLQSTSQRDLPERHRTFAATVGWSYQLLDATQQRVFRHLCVMTGPFPLEAAAAVVGDGGKGKADRDAVLLSVADLLDKSLLRRVPSSSASRTSYQMLETVRAFGVRELDTNRERQRAMEGLAAYCRAEALAASDGLVGSLQAEWLDRVRDDLDNDREVLDWLIDGRQTDAAADIACGLLWFWLIRGHVLEGLGWYERILRLPDLSAGTEARVLRALAVMHYSTGALDAARAALARSRAIAERSNDRLALLEIDCVRGHVEHQGGNLDEARAFFERAASAPGPPAWRRGSALTGLGWVALEHGDLAEAERLLDEATVSLKDAGPWFMLLVEFLRATAAVHRGDAEAAIGLVRTSLARIRILRDQFAFLYALMPLAGAAALEGKHTWVARILGAHDAVAELTDAAVVNQYLHQRLADIERDSRAAMAIDEWSRAYAAGRTTSFDELAIDIDRQREELS